MMLFRFNSLGFRSFEFICITGVSAFGLLGFTFSILSNFFDPSIKKGRNKIQTFVFHIGMIVVFTGIITHLMHWPFTLLFFLSGLVIIAVSFFIKIEQSESNDDLLDGKF